MTSGRAHDRIRLLHDQIVLFVEEIMRGRLAATVDVVPANLVVLLAHMLTGPMTELQEVAPM
jgi:hypothetical protein